MLHWRALMTMTEFGTRMIDRTAALKLAVRRVGRLLNLDDPSGAAGCIGFNRREMKRRDVVALIGGQPTEEVCTAGQPFWFQRRVWFEIGVAIERDEIERVATS
jgi:hypothetical protein